MPIRYRRYYLQKLVETHEKQNEEMEKKFGKGNFIDDKSSKSSKSPPPIPDFAFKTRAPKK